MFKKFMLFSLVLFVSIFSINGLYATEKGDSTKKVERPTDLPRMNLFPDFTMKIYYDNDSQFELSETNYKKVFVIAEYLIANPDKSAYLVAWQHENEEKGTAKLRINYIREKMVEIGVNPNRVLGKPMRDLIPQDVSDVFTPEELVEAKRIDLKIIR